MSRTPSVLIFVGSLRKDSFNRKLADALTKLGATPPLNFNFAEIGTHPSYNQDLETETRPAGCLALRKQIHPRRCDTVSDP